MSTLTPNYNLIKPDSSDPFGDFRSDYNDNLDIIDANLGGGGGSGGHTIIDPNGTDMTQRTGLQFTGNVSVSDDGVNDKTVVDILGGSNLILDAKIFSTEEKQVGVWTNQKPLYQKTVYYAGGVNGNVTFAHGISDIDEIVSVDGIAKDTDIVGDFIPFARIRSDSLNIGISDVTLTNVIYYVPSQFGGRIVDIYVTILYTKTTDSAGSGGYQAYGFTPVIYSDVERVIGVWRDNKPLYQKTLILRENGVDLYTYSGNSYLNCLPNDIEFINIVEMFMPRSGGDAGYVDVRNNYNEVQVVPNISNQSIYLHDNHNPTDTILTIQYTKTTDVAGSGDYNTYGVPTVHYSTSEQVIGTWIDGKPLYQMTIQFTSSSGTGWTDYAHGISDIDTAVSVIGYVKDSSGSIYSDGGSGDLEFALGRTYISFYTNSGYFSSSDVFATVQYTKTTD